MRLLRVKLHQALANYRKPMNYGFVDTYPLPPFSTVKGWFHYVIEATEYRPLNMCIQGSVPTVFMDLQTMIKFDRIRDNKKKNVTDPRPRLEGFKRAFSTSPTYVANIFENDLTIYFQSDQKLLDRFEENILVVDFPSMGRREDLVRIDDVRFVDLEERTFTGRNYHKIDHGIYLNRETANATGIEGINYRMNFKYRIVEGLRYFDKKDIVYVDTGIIDNASFFYDTEENNIVEMIGDYAQ
ncbi:MAG: type I-B CRISPR-associated protein Cas5b [Syntrophorhabdaceae bacterium]|nr:type I-B CRISPR-associated protein Cas5b [Syntrophorhabdaceae bacterium]